MAPLSHSGNAISAGCRRFSLPPLIAQFAKKSSTSCFNLRRKISYKASNVTLLRLSIAFAWLLTELDLGFVPSTAETNRPRKPQNSTHVLNCKDGSIAGGPSTAAPFCVNLYFLCLFSLTPILQHPGVGIRMIQIRNCSSSSTALKW